MIKATDVVMFQKGNSNYDVFYSNTPDTDGVVRPINYDDIVTFSTKEAAIEHARELKKNAGIECITVYQK